MAHLHNIISLEETMRQHDIHIAQIRSAMGFTDLELAEKDPIEKIIGTIVKSFKNQTSNLYAPRGMTCIGRSMCTSGIGAEMASTDRELL